MVVDGYRNFFRSTDGPFYAAEPALNIPASSSVENLLHCCSLYLELLLLGETFDSLPRGGLAHKGHDSDQRRVAVQHGRNFLHALTER